MDRKAISDVGGSVESVTSTVNGQVPVEVGTPSIRPLEPIVSPSGSIPPINSQR